MNFEQQEPQAVKVYVGGRISAAGYYKGTIKQSFDMVFGSGAVALQLDFESDQGQSGRIWINIVKKDGGKNKVGYETLQGQIMPLLGLKSLREQKNGIAKVYDYKLGSEVDKTCTTYPQLIGKNIGAFFSERKSISEKDGKEYTNYEADSYYDYEIGKTAHEVKNNLPADTLATKLKLLEERKYVESKAETQPKTATYDASASSVINDGFDNILMGAAIGAVAEAMLPNTYYDDYCDNVPF